jgi:MYXO-CTERM domain-containing protein
MQNGVLGVSPFSCGYISNSISFTFANVVPNDVGELCWTVAQETAHSWGLDHKFDNRDPMTYLQSGPARKNFMNESGSCGEFQARQCDCGGSSMNSYAEIMDTFGGNTPTPPTLNIVAPMNGATGLSKGFAIQAQAQDDVGVAKVELRIDNMLISTKESGPFAWAAPMNLSDGNHQIEITAYDYSGTSAKQMVTASIGNACVAESDCPSGNVCLQGRCVLGGGQAGGLGTSCGSPAECSSGQCAGDGAGTQLCVEACDPALDACPSGFECLGETGTAVCWPSQSEGICNVGSNGGGKAAPTFLLLGLAALFVTRRRRK